MSLPLFFCNSVVAGCDLCASMKDVCGLVSSVRGVKHFECA
jgi:hypothetical protein